MAITHCLRERSRHFLKQHAIQNGLNAQKLFDCHEKAEKPVSYIIGSQPFADSLQVQCQSPILIPRSETEEWCVKIAEKFRVCGERNLRVLEIGSGSGCVALTIADAISHTNGFVLGIDADPDAVLLAQSNQKQSKIENCRFERHRFESFAEMILKHSSFHSDKLHHGDKHCERHQRDEASSSTNLFDLIVSNPPYIAAHSWSSLPASVRRWETPRALISSELGVGFLRQIIERAQSLLAASARHSTLPQLVLEFGEEFQVPLIARLLQRNGFIYTLHRDLFGRNRYFTAKLQPNLQ